MTATTQIQIANAPATLPDMLLDPSQITAGNPVARGTILTQSSDKKTSSGFWSCEEGEFEWQFTWDEFVHMLEGSVTITEENGSSRTLKAGDAAHFPLGLKTHWHVTSAVRKFFVIRTPEPLSL